MGQSPRLAPKILVYHSVYKKGTKIIPAYFFSFSQLKIKSYCILFV